MEIMAIDRGVPLTRISAIDADLLSSADFDRLHPKSDLRRMTAGEVACFLSHRKA
jgi:GR25 family glycosyltransferase involved in LPS biosynthesis